MSEKEQDKDTAEDKEEGRVIRDLKRRPRSRKHREIVLPSGEWKKRANIGWEDGVQNNDEN